MSRWPAFTLFIVVAVWSELPAQVQDEGSLYFPPFALLAQYDFTEGEFFRPLGTVSGTWVASGGTFNSTSTTLAIATIDSYRPQTVFHESLTEIAGKFFYRAAMLNQSSGSSTRVGIVYQYQDPGNFYEASFSPTGSVIVREVSNGLGKTVATGTYRGGGQNKWFDVEVAWTPAETIVLVNDVPVVRGIRQNSLTHGRAGVITRQTTAKFDRLLVTIEYGDPQFRESFSGGAPSWTVAKGNWSVVDGAYRNSAVQHGSITWLPINVGLDDSTQTSSFEVYARMFNPYGGSGNRMGFVHNYSSHDGTYEEIVFGADGIARINHVQTWVESDGTTNVNVTPGETAPYPWARNHWFDVRFTGQASIDEMNRIQVSVNGTPVFTNLERGHLRGPMGLVTNWTPGRFDDVWFSHGGFSRTETFDRQDPTKPPYWFSARGTWDAEGGVLNDRTVAANDIVYTSWQGSTNYTVSARMLNPYRASGNRIGLIFGFDPATGNYYEVVFAPTGQAALNKFIQGQLTEVAKATHSALGANVWFNVELARRGPNATVKVNNQTVFENVPAAQLDNPIKRGRVGVISHWSPGRFDDLRFEDFVPR
jgi:hypothetical protein